MAELAVITSIVQLADVGLRLSLKLYAFGETMASADRAIISVSKDVSMTSSVLQELGQTLKRDQQARLCSKTALQTANGIVKECLVVFQELESMLETSAAKVGPKGKGKGKWTLGMLERLKWPFLQPKMQLLRGNLERLKTTLLLMLNVIIYAGQLSEKDQDYSQVERQRALIEDLARSKDEYTRKFEALTLAIESSTVKGDNNVDDTASLPSVIASPTLLQSSYQHEFNPVVAGIKHYCNLINNLLREVNAVEHQIEAELRSRIKTDVVGAHQRETQRLMALYGKKNVRDTITGEAWDVVEQVLSPASGLPTQVEQGPRENRPYDASVDSLTEVPTIDPKIQPLPCMNRRNSVLTNEATAAPHESPQIRLKRGRPIEIGMRLRGPLATAQGDVYLPSKSRKTYSQPHQDETERAIEGLESPSQKSPHRSPALSMPERSERIGSAWSLAYTDALHDHTSPPAETPSGVGSDTAQSPASTSRMTQSGSISPRGDEEMMNGDMMSLGESFEVHAHDDTLPLANISRIMKAALPDDAKIAKETKSLMAECVSEFIAFITSEAAEKIRQERRKLLDGEDVLFAMRSLGFENYAEALHIYLSKYREHQRANIRVGQGYKAITTPFEYHPDNLVRKEYKVKAIPFGQHPRMYKPPRDASESPSDDDVVMEIEPPYTHNVQERTEAIPEGRLGGTHGNVVDDLLSQWTTLPVKVNKTVAET
ncbi:MAG: hypothetical protein M1833_007380 [Piccolia ochrophora]|nr:MAG: hypothetical protein M1833_007380 [Piccolia ochrophora]